MIAAMFLRNCWYVAAWGSEVKRLALMRRILLGEPVVLYRRTDGRPVALEDRCCHRHAPLSAGRIRGDNVECGYHGFTYDPSGKCVLIPTQDSIPPNARVKSYPVAERHQFIWIWMGDPALADESLIEDFHWLDDPAWRHRGERLQLQGNYLLLVENLCDLTHLPFVHAGSLGTTAVPHRENPGEVVREGNGLKVERWTENVPVTSYFRSVAGFPREAVVDRWMNLVFTPPAFVRLDIGAALAGTGARSGDRSKGVTTRNLNAITPETEKSTHYFWAQAQNFGTADPSVTELDFRLTHGAFLEDLAMIVGQQQNIDLDPEVPRISVATDSGGMQARRIVESLIAAEQKGTPKLLTPLPLTP
ncbi:MAG: aromatic ring-hydroxylating dioxygenase subunit alpha [Betaproteobacteria bacterium]|nr:aromatic ring-hydroxylating dioxygenase subunit alpha [Betaproteobacteria bacterium]